MAGGGQKKGVRTSSASSGLLGRGGLKLSRTRSDEASTVISAESDGSRRGSLDTDTGESDGIKIKRSLSDAVSRTSAGKREDPISHHRGASSAGVTETNMLESRSHSSLPSGRNVAGSNGINEGSHGSTESNHFWNRRLYSDVTAPASACPDYAGTSVSASTSASSSSDFSRHDTTPGVCVDQTSKKASRRRLHSSNSQRSAVSVASNSSEEGRRPFGMPRRPSADELEAIQATASPIAFFTDANNKCDHQTRISVTPLTRIPYVHGGYSAVAPIMIRDARWMTILRKLMPESHTGIATLLKKAEKSFLGNKPGAAPEIDPIRVMKWAENNPVVAAYGMLNSDAGRRPTESHNQMQRGKRRADPKKKDSPPLKPALEWDVFLDPILVRHVDRAMQAVEDMTESDYEARIAADIEVDRQVARLMNRMMLAHGSTTQLLAEAVGMAPKFNFSRVVEQGESRRRSTTWSSTTRILSESMGASRSTMSHVSMSPTPMQGSISETAAVQGSKSAAASGIFVERWLALFAKALQLGKEIANERNRYDTGSKRYSSALQMAGNDLPMVVRNNSRSSMTLGTDWIDEDEDAEDGSDESTILGTDEVISAPPMCGLFLCLGMDDPNSHKADHGKSFMARNAKKVQKLLGGPLRVVLDLKSRRCPPRVWARLVDNMRSRGIGVDGLGSFDMDELRSISSICCTPVSKVIFLHSAGDLQRACHAQEIKRGDTVFFNAGSLIWKKPTLCEATGFGCCAVPSSALTNIDLNEASSSSDSAPGAWNNSGVVLGGYIFQPYAYPREKLELLTGVVQETKATLEDYQKHLHLNIGLYVQEFSVGDNVLDALSRLVNHYPSIYNLGLAWGGINGTTVKGVHGDGFWNQRYIGRDWDLKAEPTDHMKLLAPEDHHLFQKAIHTSDWGQALTVNQIAINPDEEGGLHVPLCETPRYH